MSSVRKAALCGLLALALTSLTRASEPGLDWEQIQQESVELFVQYLKLDTTNPPGNETRAAKFFAEICNTISITVLEGSNKVNIIPPAAHADIDTRLVPGEQLDRWIAELKSVIKDDGIKIEPILAFNANASPVDTALVKAVAELVKQKYPDAVVTYPVQAGFTDCHYFRDLGIHSYGFSPFVAPTRELGAGVHGNDERIGQKAFTEGLKFFYEVIERMAR